MSTLVPIGEFSVMTNLSRKALRIYHDLGLLEPAEVDDRNGYRYYDTEQIATAQIIRRFRDLGLGVAEVKAVLAAPDAESRNALLTAHLQRMEVQLRQTADTVASLRELLAPGSPSGDVRFQTLPATPAWIVSAEISSTELSDWFPTALQKLITSTAASSAPITGPIGGLFERELIADEHGRITVYVPTSAADPPAGLASGSIPGGDYAIITHHGSHADADRSYGALGRYVSEHLIGAPGPVRERYLPADRPGLGPLDVRFGAPDSRTEICWPILTAAVAGAPE